MSRSYKSVPGYSESEGKKRKRYFLRVLNRRIRRLDPMEESEGLANGNGYRKYVSRWDFRDYNFRYFSRRELEESWYGEHGVYKAIRK
jgi:hypothetical protein